MTARVVIVDMRSRSARLQQRDSSSVLDELRIAWVIAPSHRDQIAGPVSDDGFPPTGISIIPGNHKMADTNVIPVARITLGNRRGGWSEFGALVSVGLSAGFPMPWFSLSDFVADFDASISLS